MIGMQRDSHRHTWGLASSATTNYLPMRPLLLSIIEAPPHTSRDASAAARVRGPDTARERPNLPRGRAAHLWRKPPIDDEQAVDGFKRLKRCARHQRNRHAPPSRPVSECAVIGGGGRRERRRFLRVCLGV